jgi:hypothetical protein
VVFFLIIKNWAENVKKTLVSSKINWNDVPGYKIIMKCVLLEMKHREIINYPDALIECTQALLSNEKLLNVFVTIVFRKTSPIHNSDVLVCLDMITSWMEVLHSQGLEIPSSFDFNFFYQGVQMLIDQDHGVSTSKCLWMLYKIIHIFPQDQKRILLTKILEPRQFYSLFFHWSWNVRHLFYLLFYFQLHREYFRPEAEIKELESSKPKKVSFNVNS